MIWQSKNIDRRFIHIGQSISLPMWMDRSSMFFDCQIPDPRLSMS